MNGRRLEVVCFGALNMDKLYRVDRIARADEESRILSFIESPGGSAANTAVGLARLGVKTGYIGKVASDRDGDRLLKDFLKESVDVSGVIVSKYGRSGSVMGFVDNRGERALYVDPGVNDDLRFDEIDLEYLSGVEYLHLTSFVGDQPFNAQKRLVSLLSNVKITLDPGSLYARRGLRELMPIIERCFALMPSEDELRLITKMDYKEGSKFLVGMGVKVVAVKLGERGCYITDGEEEHWIDSYKVNVVDTTGAGDAFNAGFLYGLIRRKSLRECGLLGNYVASRCIMRMGARNGLPRLEELPPNLR